MELTLDEALKKGVEAHQAGQIQEAERLYTAILKAQPKHPDTNHNMGVLAVGVGKIQEALPFFKTAVEANLSIGQFWLSYIDALIKLGKLADAKAVFVQAKGKGADGKAFDQLGTILNDNIKTSAVSEASQLIQQAIQLRETGEFATAVKLLANRINDFSSSVELLSLLAHCYILNDDKENASIYLEKAKEIDSHNASVNWNDVRLLLKNKNVSDALKVARKTIEQYPDDVEGMGVIGACLRASNHIDESLLYLDKAITLNPNYAEALINRGLIKLIRKDKLGALSDLETAHKLKPHIKQILDLVVDLNLEFKHFDQATSLLVKMVESNPNNGNNFAKLALCNQNLGDLDAAIENYKKALIVRPDHAEAYINMGTALNERGDLEAAIDSYKHALKIKPDYAKAYYNMGNALNHKNDPQAAIDSYKQALKIKPDHAEAHSSLAFVLIGIGNRDEALLNLKRSHELIRGKNPVNPYHNSFLTISKAKMDHDIDQFKYLADSGYEAAKFNALADLYRDVSLKIDWSIGEIQPLSNKHQKLLKNTYNRPINVLEAPEVLNGPISTTLDRGNITKGYSKHDHGLTYIDNFLTPSALDSIREFLLGSTIWHDIKEGGYLGAYLRDGLACPLLLQIANELRVAFPEIFKGHQLLHLWAYKYDSGAYKDDNGLTGIRAHADEAAVNVNFWITPATANLNPESGGLIVYNKPAPLEWDFKKFNSNHEEIAKHLNYGSCEKTIVPYNENRAVIFNSNLIHETDKFEFKEGYENRRINITMLFGHRGD